MMLIPNDIDLLGIAARAEATYIGSPEINRQTRHLFKRR